MAATQVGLSVFVKVPSGAQRRRRVSQGFTLVELLVVIAIIAMLMGIISVAVWKALDAAKQARVIVEIEQLSSSMNAYKEKNVQYPPSLAELDYSTTLSTRRIHFMRHVQVAFANANYGVTAAHFENLRTAIKGNTLQPYYYRNAAGTATLLDLATLDQAESLVFWLGGFPTPCTTGGVPISSSKLFGFNRDRDAPMKRDSAVQEGIDAMRFRTDPLYDFKQERLVDNDNDGWYEYVPVAVAEGVRVAPYVYFDAPTYNASTTAAGVSPFDVRDLCGYPRVAGPTPATSPSAADLAADWGMAVPLAEAFDGSRTPMRWKQPMTFQIIAPGKDGKYSSPVTSDLAAAMRLPVFPTGETYTKGSGYDTTKKISYSVEELDNLTNLATSSLDEARQSLR